jgi:chromosome segregation ATPase
MELPDRLTSSLRRLTGALDLLEAAAERRAQADATRADLEMELSVMQDDRARLGSELDKAMANTERLLAANAEVGERLDRVSAALRDMLGQSTETFLPLTSEPKGVP